MGTTAARPRFRFSIILTRTVRMVFAVVVGVCVVLWAAQEMLLFPASRDVWRTPADSPFGWKFETVTLRVGAETTIAWYIPTPNARGVILFSHGNGGNIADRIEHYAMLRDLGYDVFAYDYGGYGGSSGRPSEQRCYADIRAAWRYLVETRGTSPDKIVLFGESLGGGVACDLAVEVDPRALIVQNSFLSVTKVAKEHFPILPVGLLLKHRFDSESKIGKVTAPLLIIHSPEDSIIPYHHGRGLFDLARAPKNFLELHGDHNDCIFTSERAYRDGMQTFLDSLPPNL